MFSRANLHQVQISFQSRTDESVDARLSLIRFSLSVLFIMREIVVRACSRSDNTQNTKKSILISESDGVHLQSLGPACTRNGSDSPQNILSCAALKFLTVSIRGKQNNTAARPICFAQTTSIFAIAIKCLEICDRWFSTARRVRAAAHPDLPAAAARRLSVKAAQITQLLRPLSPSLISVLIVEEDRS